MRRRGNPLMRPGQKRFLSFVDVVLFALDARIPQTSVRVAEKYLHACKFAYVLTRVDLADPGMTRLWIDALAARGQPAFGVRANTGEGMKEIVTFLDAERDRINLHRAAGSLTRPLRLMVFGLPNVGKSSLINRLSGQVRSPAGGKPGLTRGIHWIRCGDKFLLLDTPGVLEPGQVRGDTLMALAATGAIAETRYDPVEVALWLIPKVQAGSDPGLALFQLEQFGRDTGQVKKGGEVDLTRASQVYLARFRRGELGRFTLELPERL